MLGQYESDMGLLLSPGRKTRKKVSERLAGMPYITVSFSARNKYLYGLPIVDQALAFCICKNIDCTGEIRST